MPEEKAELPGELVAGTTVIYHLGRSWKAGDDPHRVGIVSGIRRQRDRVVADLTVFLQPDDGDSRDTMLAIRDAEYDPECPADTFCLVTDGEDELMSVADWQAQIDRESQEHKDKKTRRPEPLEETNPVNRPIGGGAKTHDFPESAGKIVTKDIQATNEGKLEGELLSGNEMKAKVEGKTVGEVKAETPDFTKPAEAGPK